MTSKQEKKELEAPDQLTVFLMKIRAFIETHRSRIFIGAGAVAVLFLLAGGVYFYQMNYEKKAANLYNDIFNAQIKATSPDAADVAIKGYNEMISKYSRSDAAMLAHYRLANLHFKKQDYDNAKSSYQKFIDRASSDNDLLTLAYHGLGACEEMKKDFKKALEYYEMAMKTKAAASFEFLNYQNAARMYEVLKDNKKAVDFYQKALSKTADPVKTILLKRKISSLS